VRRQDQQKFVVQADGFVDLLVEFPAALNVVRGAFVNPMLDFRHDAGEAESRP
jgi:hypothetical protein